MLTKHLAAMNALSDFVQVPSRKTEQAMREAEGEFRAAIAQAAPSQVTGERVDWTEVVEVLRNWSATKWNTESPLGVSIAMTAAGSAILMARVAIESLQASAQREQPSASKPEPQKRDKCNRSQTISGDFVCDCKLGECPGQPSDDRAAQLDAMLTKILNRRVAVEQELFDMAAGKKPMPDAAKLRELAMKLGDPAITP